VSRRRLTIKRIDPWSVLKVGAVVNLCIWAIVLIGFGVLWFFVLQLGLVERACDVATRVSELDCSVSGTGIFRSLVLLGFIGAIIQTGLFVVAAFLYNTISQMVGGLQFIVQEGTGTAVEATSRIVTEKAEPTESKPREPIGAAATRTKDKGEDESAGEGGGPLSEVRRRARDLASRRQAEVEEARELEMVRRREEARRAAAGQTAPAANQPIKRRPDA
jgi:hypothetical protein